VNLGLGLISLRLLVGNGYVPSDLHSKMWAVDRNLVDSGFDGAT
jgi:hypothetical protein